MRKEKPKKTEIITFRTTEEVKKELEKEAEIREWTVSQLSEKIIANYVYNYCKETPSTIKVNSEAQNKKTEETKDGRINC